MAGLTLAEKVLQAHTKEEVKPGKILLANVDKCLFQDWTGPLSIAQIEELRFKKLKLAKSTYFFIDHAAPSSHLEHSTNHIKIREFCKKFGVKLHDIEQGVCHQHMIEQYARPGDVILGSDSHTCLPGSLGAFSCGMGSTDVAIACALGKTWFRVPESIKVHLNGGLPKNVFSKDVILALIGKIRADGATYKALEYHGSYITKGPFENRMILGNMAVEAGAKVGMCASDQYTKDWLRKQKRVKDFRKVAADKDATYEREVGINVKNLVPQVACPHTVDNVYPVTHKKCKNVKIHQVLVGSCSNADLQDYQIVHKVLKGEKLAKGTRLVITPPSKRVLLHMIDKGWYHDLIESGAAITGPGCGACPGSQTGLLGDGENAITTTNRNFKGRLGNPKAFVYLASPATAAVAALRGKITDPREVL